MHDRVNETPSDGSAEKPGSKLSGKTAVVFGGGSIGGEVTNGLASALAYARAGAQLAIVDLGSEASQDAKSAILAQVPDAKVLALQGDVTDTDSISGCVAEIVESTGRIDVLHNNVGVATMGGPLELEVHEWEQAIRLNLTSAFVTTKHVLPVMLEQQHGSIINIASVGGMRYVGYNYPAYAAAKAGLVQFTTNLGLHYAHQGIRANTISPGLISSPMIFQQITGNYSSADEMVAQRNAMSPTGAMGEPEDVAAAALFLASDDAKYINGICLPVDGGYVEQVSAPTRND